MHGRYADYDVLEHTKHGDEATRSTVPPRVSDVPPVGFFDPRDAATVEALTTLLLLRRDSPPPCRRRAPFSDGLTARDGNRWIATPSGSICTAARR